VLLGGQQHERSLQHEIHLLLASRDDFPPRGDEFGFVEFEADPGVCGRCNRVNQLRTDIGFERVEPCLCQCELSFGARDPALADDPTLDYADAAEVLWVMERLPTTN
jgi:hypothetical protein